MLRRLRQGNEKGNDMNLAIGIVMVAAAAALIYFGLPDRQGNSPRFLRFGAALVLYPPVILVVSAFGLAELYFSLMQ